MLYKFHKIPIIAVALLLPALAACTGSAPTRFYLLNPLEGGVQKVQKKAVPARATIGIGPVSFPAYLDRQQMVTRVGDNELHLAGFDEWAEPLKDNFTRVLVENLSRLLPADTVIVFPFRGPETVDWQISVEIIRLDGSLAGEVLLNARWSIYDRKKGHLLLTKKSAFSHPVDGPEYGDLAAAHGRAVEALSREMGRAIQTLCLDGETP